VKGNVDVDVDDDDLDCEERMGEDDTFRSLTRLAREHNASESIPANVFRFNVVALSSSVGESSTDEEEEYPESFSCTSELVGVKAEDEAVAEDGEVEELSVERKLFLNLTTSSKTSSSHKLSLNPSLARMSISSAFTGIVITIAELRGVTVV
jgi:hypothetical protein